MFVPPLFFWSAVKKELAWDEKKALERFLGKEGIRKTQGGYYLECEDRKHC